MCLCTLAPVLSGITFIRRVIRVLTNNDKSSNHGRRIGH